MIAATTYLKCFYCQIHKGPEICYLLKFFRLLLTWIYKCRSHGACMLIFVSPFSTTASYRLQQAETSGKDRHRWLLMANQLTKCDGEMQNSKAYFKNMTLLSALKLQEMTCISHNNIKMVTFAT